MKKYIIGIIIGVCIGIVTFIFIVRNANSHNALAHFHEHANFAVFLNGTRFDFSQIQYMSTEPCTEDEAEEEIPQGDSPEILRKVVHLHNQKGDTVHVHRAGITWANFFASLSMNMKNGEFTDDKHRTFANTNENTFRYFVNGKEVSEIASKEIRDLDQVLMTYGPKNRSESSLQLEMAQIGNTACEYSGSCASRGPAPTESCGASKKPTLLQNILGL